MTRNFTRNFFAIFAFCLFSANAHAAAFQFGGIRHDLTKITSAAGTTTLTKASLQVQNVTGTTTQTIQLPSSATLAKGYWYTITNDSTGTVTLNDGSGALLGSLTSGQSFTAYLSAVSGTAGTWTLLKGGSGITSVTGTAPVVSSGGSTPAISMPAATNSVAGYLTAADHTSYAGKADGTRTVNAQTGTTYTFALTDGSNNASSTIVTLTNSSQITATVPPNSSVAFPVGSQIDITQGGAGLVTLAPGAGVTLNAPTGLTMLGQYTAATLVKTATDTWSVFGTGTTAGTALTDWQAYTPTFNGFGTVVTQAFFWRRVGDSVQVSGKFTIATANAALGEIFLPNGLVFDTSKVPAIKSVGTYFRGGSAVASKGGAMLASPSDGTGFITFGQVNTFNSTSVDPLTNMTVNNLGASGDVLSVDFTVPISGWTAGAGYSSPVMSLTDWKSYVPSYTGFGTVSSQAAWWRRVGDTIEIQVTFTSGTPTATEARVSLPNSYVSDPTKLTTLQIVGFGARNVSNAEHIESLVEPSVSYVTFGRQEGSIPGVTKQNGTGVCSNGNIVSFFAKIPIASWTSVGAGTLTAPRSEVYLDGTGGTVYGSTNTRVFRYANIQKNVGADITYADSASLGASFTINSTGIYTISFGGSATGTTITECITVNGTALTTSCQNPLTYAQGLRGPALFSGANSARGAGAWTGNLNLGDVVRIQGDGTTADNNALQSVDIVKVSN